MGRCGVSARLEEGSRGYWVSQPPGHSVIALVLCEEAVANLASRRRQGYVYVRVDAPGSAREESKELLCGVTKKVNIISRIIAIKGVDLYGLFGHLPAVCV
jgi:hypothetical protein